MSLLLALWVVPTHAQEGASEEAPPDVLIPLPDSFDIEGKGMPEIQVHCADADAFGGTRLERGAWCLLRQKKYIGARTFAEATMLENTKHELLPGRRMYFKVSSIIALFRRIPNNNA